jgi:predicted DNA-binding protein
MAMVTLRLDDELNERLTRASRHTGQSKSQIIKGLLRANMDEIEKLQSLEERIAEYRKQKAEGTLETMTFDEFKARNPEIFAELESKVRRGHPKTR